MNPLVIRNHLGDSVIRLVAKNSLLEGCRPGDVVITDENVAQAFSALLEGFDPVVVTPGEESKSFDSYGKILQNLAKRGTRRDSTLFALGGGVIGDLAGFAAASYMRGIKLIMVPTSLLAMVDSSVGGKVGIDLPEGKNLVGAFYPPKEVRVAPTALATLPERHWFNGMAEVWKYGFIMDPLLLQSLRKGGLSKQSEEISWLIMRCIENKAKVVQEDEFETTGKRATLNFGHTIGHAIEKVLGYKDLLHGEAISIGMVEEAKLGERLGMTPKGLSHQVAQDLSSSALPIRLPDGLDAEEIVKAMRLDKKTDHQGLTFCMVTGEGTCTIVKGLTEETVLQSLRHS